MNVNSIITRIYEDKSRFWLKKNKANSKPILNGVRSILLITQKIATALRASQ